MKCVFCDAEIPENEKVCPACGAPVEEVPAKAAPAEEVKAAPAAPAKNEGKTMGIVGMCLGIGALVLLVVGYLGGCCTMGLSVPVCAVISFIVSIVAIILCAKAKKKSKKSGHKNGMAIAGLICAIITLVITAIMGIATLILLLIYGVAIFAELAAAFG